MDDRKLLELAAKAAGIDHPGGEHCVNGPALWDCKALRWWQPLTDDGDALRLAVKLHIRIWGPGHAETQEGRPCIEGESSNENANTRRAIVRAAAEIGKDMP
ncbi:hypothetical protein [Metapseudomonas otitidis]|uniref:hypothetical protein n=1 Tax=Metapseudomonas otitidis TaxID=319939 RepID=UPI0024477C04|nr:hypothetical protein [Pseudomonas otitidis]MDG9785250.1 hypothetical protein [Pseudomonas otitidis]